MTDLPQPLTPADCNLRGMPFMPMMVSQVMQSETFGLSTGDQFKAAFALWCASWSEVPAASLPNNPGMLAFLSRAKSWSKVKDVALRGWVLCSDGRLYHPVIAERAIEAWDKRTVYRDKEDTKNERQQRWREQCKLIAGQLRDRGITPPRGASLETLKGLLETNSVDAYSSTLVDGAVSTVDDVEIAKRGRERVKGQCKGEGEVNLKEQPLLDDLPVAAPEPEKIERPKKPKTLPAEPGTGKAWVAYANAYWNRYSVEPVRNAMVNGQLSQLVKRIGAADAEQVAAFYVGHRHRFYVEKMHPVGLLLADCEKLRTEWATATQMTATRAKQVDRTQTNLDAFAPLIAAAREREQAEKEAQNASK